MKTGRLDLLPGRILVIEDNPTNLELIAYLLKSFKHTVFFATDGAEGIEALHREPVDLIICDVHLPKLDGYEVARYLKKHSVLRRIPLVAVTALAMVGDREKVLAAGFDGYITKPIAPEKFVQQIETLIHTVGPALGRAAASSEGGGGTWPLSS